MSTSSNASLFSNSSSEYKNQRHLNKAREAYDKNSVQNVNTLERTNTNVYFWYYKNNECQRNSCKSNKIKIRFPKLSKEKIDPIKIENSHFSTSTSIYPFQSYLANDKTFFLEEKSIISKSDKHLNQANMGYYTKQQEDQNKKNFTL